jgi:predicted ester cyclase
LRAVHKGNDCVTTEQNKAILDRIPAEISKGNLGIFDELFSRDAVDHTQPPGSPKGPAGPKQFFAMLRAAFPDLTIKTEATIAEGDLVVHRATSSGTMKGPFQGMPATGKHATWTEIHIARIQNGKVVEHWANMDQLGMLQQLGLAPTPGK